MAKTVTDKAKATFTIPFTQVQNKVIDSESFTNPIDKLVYISLLRFAFNSGEAFPSIKKLARMNVSSENRIRAAIKRLEEMGLVTIEKRESESGCLANLYKIHDLDEGQNLQEGASKSEGAPVQKLKGPGAKIEAEEEELNNNKNLTREYMNNPSVIDADQTDGQTAYTSQNQTAKQSPDDAKRQEIEQSPLPMPVKKSMMTNIKRMVDDALNVDDVTAAYDANTDDITDKHFSDILNNALHDTAGTIRNLRKLLNTCIKNDRRENGTGSDAAIYSGETLDLFAEFMGA